MSKKLNEKILQNLKESVSVVENLQNDKVLKKIADASALIIKTIKNNNKLIFAGDGGSAAHSQHISAEYVSKYLKVRKPYPAISLTTDTSALTSISNDFGYEYIFEKQLIALAKPGDVFCCYSTSGKSENIIKAAKWAKKNKLFIISYTNYDTKNILSKLSNISFNIQSKSTPNIQEAHLVIDHLLCEIVESNLLKIKLK